MNFDMSQEHKDLQALAAKIFTDLVPVEKLPDFEEPQDWYDEKLWSELAKASLLGLGIPEDLGGAGMGIVEVCGLLEEAGRRLAPAPLLPTLLMGAAPIVEFGTAAQQRAILPAVAGGKSILTAALAEDGSRDPLTVATRARRDGSGWKLDGAKAYVPVASLASHILVPARLDDETTAVFIVERDATGVSLEALATTTGELEYRVTLAGVVVAPEGRLGDGKRDDEILPWLIDRTIAGLCATELGIADRALRMTAEYTATRKQFDKPIATFQAVAQRAADAYIDLEAMRLSTQQAIWRLASGRDAKRELRIAKFWASEGGHRVCYAAQHLHGGIGVDTDYPLHHYYLKSRHIELTLGGAHTHLMALGERLAAEGPAHR
jgi:alkylation response protein AidB-like acyl-CoA dehydrogenase